MSKKHGKNWDLIVAGGGASGMMAAIAAAESGAHVLLLEQKNCLGKKLSATGNGRCNFTNADMDLVHFYGNRELAGRALSRFSLEDTLSFFHRIGILPKQKNGYYYPHSGQAASVVRALETELRRKDVSVCTGEEVTEILPLPAGFRVNTGNNSYITAKLLLATGLFAAPKLGGGASMVRLIERLGHHFSEIVPALCGFCCEGADFAALAGVRTDGRITVYIDGEEAAQDSGELQFTDYGISGIPTFQVSRTASLALAEGKQVQASLDFLPELGVSGILEELQLRIRNCKGFETTEEGCNGLLPAKLLPVLIQKAGISRKTRMKELSDQEAGRLAETISDFTVDLVRARGYESAQVCAGGLDSAQIDPDTLESRLVPGLFFAGELLNVDGVCGGYNLQWAWSSGYLAGKSAAAEAGKGAV